MGDLGIEVDDAITEQIEVRNAWAGRKMLYRPQMRRI
jgi:hypothetical protein